MLIIKMFFFSILITGQAIAQSPGFDCKKSFSKQEKIICNDVYLSLLDQVLNRFYNLKHVDKEEQAEWLKSRQNIQKTPDLQKFYESRLQNLTLAYFRSLNNADEKVISDIMRILHKVDTIKIYQYKFAGDFLNSDKKDHLETLRKDLYATINIEAIDEKSLNPSLKQYITKFPSNLPASVFAVDYNNDKKMELIIESINGSLGVYSFNLIEQNAKGYEDGESIEENILDKKNKPIDRGNGFFPYRPMQHRNLFSVYGDDLIMEFENFQTYFRKGDVLIGYCNDRWIDEVISKIQQLTKTQDLASAQTLSSFYSGSCTENKKSSELIYLNANASYLRSDPVTCLSEIKKLKQPFDKKSLELNCQTSLANINKNKNLSLIEACKSKATDLSLYQRRMLKIIFDKDVTSSRCQEEINEVVKNGLNITTTPEMSIDDLSILNNLSGVKSLSLNACTSHACGYNGGFEIKDWKPVEDLGLETIELSELGSFFEKKHLWKFILNTKIQNIKVTAFSDELTTLQLSAIKENKNIKQFTLNGKIIKGLGPIE